MASILFYPDCSLLHYLPPYRPADLKSCFLNLMSWKTVATKLDTTNKVCFHGIKESLDKVNELVMPASCTDPCWAESQFKWNALQFNCLCLVSAHCLSDGTILFFLQTTFLLGTFLLDNCLRAHHTEHYNGNYSL